MKRNLIIAILLAVASTASAQQSQNQSSQSASASSTRRERNYIRQGNKLYENKQFADAEVAYRKALDENAASPVAMYNLAASLIRQAGSANPNEGNNPLAEAQSLLQSVASVATNAEVTEKALYNLGNMAFNQQQYNQAINMYKDALRRNPDNNQARENLRLAQLKRQQQQQQQQQDQNQNKDQQNQDKDKRQDQQQNKDENKDKNDNNQDKQQQKPEQQKQMPEQRQNGISDSNADKILKAMENEENATRRKVQDMKKAEAGSASRRSGNQW